MQSSTEAQWIRCRYFAFWDVPRTWTLPWQGKTLLLDSPFEAERDDYSPSCSVWELFEAPAAGEAPSWEQLQRRIAGQRHDVPVTAFEFDAPRKKADGCFFVRVRPAASYLMD